MSTELQLNSNLIELLGNVIRLSNKSDNIWYLVLSNYKYCRDEKVKNMIINQIFKYDGFNWEIYEKIINSPSYNNELSDFEITQKICKECNNKKYFPYQLTFCKSCKHHYCTYKCMPVDHGTCHDGCCITCKRYECEHFVCSKKKKCKKC